MQIRISPLWTSAGMLLAVALAVVLAALAGCRGGAAGSMPETDGDAAQPGGPFPTIQPVGVADLARYAGSESCLPCHPRAARQAQSHHAHTAARVHPGPAVAGAPRVPAAAHAPLFRTSGHVQDLQHQIRYRTQVANNGDCQLVAEHGDQARAVRADYVFGSGNRGFSYMGQYEDQLVELRLSYYPRLRAWGYTPGQEPGTPVSTPVGRVVGMDDARHCFACHATALVEEGGQPRPEQSLLGVGCETCHGPGRAHIEAVKRGGPASGRPASGRPDIHMARLSRFRDRVSMELCGQCHRTPMSDEMRDPRMVAQLPRLQGFALARSACFRKSQGRLSCVACHDPHRDANRTSHAEYNQQCGGCHSPNAPGQVTCKFKPQGDCVACHMPTQPVSLPSRPRFRTHWIKVWGRVEQ